MKPWLGRDWPASCNLPQMSWVPKSVWILAAVTAIAAATMPHAPDLVLYNHSPSIPVGLYARMKPQRNLDIGTIVTVRARDVAPQIAADRHFDRPSNRFIKHVAARAGDRVCAKDDAVTINDGSPIFRSRMSQHYPVWNGCRNLRRDEILLLGDRADSFDGRYWGPVPAHLIEGVWRPL